MTEQDERDPSEPPAGEAQSTPAVQPESELPQPPSSGADSAGSGVEADADDEAMRALLHQAMAKDVGPDVDVLARVQKRIREGSGGKFYEDGWSTSDSPPVATYLITTLVMLAIAIGVYLVLAPISGDPKLVPTYPSEPVQVIPPR